MEHRFTAIAVRGVCIVVLLVLLTSAAFANPDPPSWNSFTPATFTNISVTPSLATGTLNYDLALDPGAQVNIGGTLYPITWIGAYFVVSQDASKTFTATNSTTVTDWRWEVQPPGSTNHTIAGWIGSGAGDRLYTGQSKHFDFASFDITENAVVSGFHIGYLVDGQEEVTLWFKDPGNPVPEPSGLLALLCGGAGVIGLFRRRKR